MSDIPPDVVGSSLQAGFQQAEISKARDAQRAAQSHAAKTGAKAIDDAGTTIETGDEDTAVFADAEGTGGQGRESEEESTEAHPESNAEGRAEGMDNEDDGLTHVDIEA